MRPSLLWQELNSWNERFGTSGGKKGSLLDPRLSYFM